MNGRLGYTVVLVSAMHGVLIFVLCVVPALWHRMFHSTPHTIPVEFMVEVPRGADRPVVREVVEERSRPVTESTRDVIPVRKKPVTPPKTTVRETRQGRPDKRDTRPKLSAEEIRKRLLQGATPGDYTSIPVGDTLYKEIIRRALYNAWEQPAMTEASGLTVEVAVKFTSDGRVAGVESVRRSGNAAMDDSVLDAVRSVTRVEGVSEEFLNRFPVVTVAFRVTEEGM